MEIVSFIIHLMSGATLLLFAVRFMRIGIERLWSVRIRQSLNGASSTPSLLAKGAGLGFVMQGATVVMLMAAGLAGSNTIPLLSAALLAMGADFGSALVVLVLTLPVGAIGPLAILAGGWLYLNADEPERRNLGRVVLGLGLIFLSLSLIRQAVTPLQQFSGATGAVSYLNSDPVTAAILGIAVTLLMHSSLAAILTALAFATHGDLGAGAGLGFVIGCNIGSALLPLWLLRGENGAATAVAKSVAILRISLAVIFLGLLIALPGYGIAFPSWSVGQLILAGHVSFNLLLLLLAPVLPVVLRQFPINEPAPDEDRFILPDSVSDPQFATMALRGQVNRMLDLLTQMFDLVTGSAQNQNGISELEIRMNRGLADLREAYSRLPDLSDEHGSQIRQIIDFAIRIESCGDLLSGKYAIIVQETRRGDYRFSDDGEHEIAALGEQVRKGILLAQNVFWAEDVKDARELVIHKQRVSGMEADSKRRHLARVRKGNTLSLGSSDGHLELIAALKSVNSKLATIGYAVLDKHGELTETRLKSVG